MWVDAVADALPGPLRSASSLCPTSPPKRTRGDSKDGPSPARSSLKKNRRRIAEAAPLEEESERSE